MNNAKLYMEQIILFHVYVLGKVSYKRQDRKRLSIRLDKIVKISWIINILNTPKGGNKSASFHSER